jgi:hypothetical protein
MKRYPVTPVPVMFSVEDAISYFANEVPWPPLSEYIDAAAGRLGRNYYPALVVDLFCADRLTEEAARLVVPSAWSAIEFPNRGSTTGLGVSSSIWSATRITARRPTDPRIPSHFGAAPCRSTAEAGPGQMIPTSSLVR